MSDPNEQPTSNTPRSAKMIVFFVVFIDLLGFGIVLPLLPRYASDYFTGSTLSTFTQGVILGVLMSSFSAMQFIFAPIWGRLSDRIGRRPVLIVGLAGSSLFYTLFGLVSELPASEGMFALVLIFLTRIGAGIAGATIPAAQAVIADTTPQAKRAHGMALIGAAFGIGFTFGPLIAFAGMQWFSDYRGAPGYLAGGLSLCALLLAIRKLPETRQVGQPGPRRSWLNVGQLFETLQTPTVGALVLTFFFATLGFAAFEGTLSMLTKDVFRVGDSENFLIFAYLGFVLMFAQGFLYRKLVKKMDEVRLMRIGVALMFMGLAGLAIIAYFSSAVVATNGNPRIYMAPFYAVLAFGVIGFAFLTPSAQGLISKRSDPHRQGEVLGINQSFAALARILGPTAGMALFAAHDSRMLPYILGGALLMCVLAMLPRIRSEKTTESPAVVAPTTEAS